MHAAVAIVQEILRPVSAQLDVRNARNLLLAVQALISARRLVLMELARYWPGAQWALAPLKRLDRLLGNRQVQTLRARFYQTAAAWMLRSQQPVLIVDWSELKSDGRWHLLRAGVPMRGRTFTVYEEVHPEAKKNSRKVQAAFLRQLKALLPPGVCPIVITDAGFQNPWFRELEALGWHWIGRVRHRTRFRWARPGQGTWAPCKALHAQASPRACSLGEVQLARRNPMSCRLVLVRRRKADRVELTRYGKRARSARSRAMAASAKEPWLLAASRSLNGLSAAAIVYHYAKRMQIEQSFRDLKSHRYGCAFEDTLTRTAERLQMLLLIHMLATLAAWLAGLGASAADSARVCVPSLAKAYSLLWIGWACLRRDAPLSSGPPAQTSVSLAGLLVAFA
jgi:Transposase DDE domain